MAHGYRYLLLDVDGTLLDRHGQASPRNLAAVRRAVAAGLALVLATGRTYPSLRRATDGLDLPPFHMVTNGGAVGLTPGGAEVRYACYLDAGQWRAVVQALEGAGQSPLVFSHCHPQPTRFHIGALPGGAHFEAYIGRNRPYCMEEPALARAEIPRVVQVAALGRDASFEAATLRVREQFAGQLRCHTMLLYLAGQHGRIAEFFAPGTSKWQAFLGLFPAAADTPEQVVAIGDEANDLEMIRAAGLGIAMGNAVPELRDAANRVTGDVDADGVAQAIEALLDG